MQVTAKLNNLRMAPRKVRLVVDLVRGKKTDKAQNILSFGKRAAAVPVLKLLNSAIANAKNNFQLDPDNLYIFKITVDGGPILKRWRARSRGQAFEIQKKTSHVTIVLEEIEAGKKLNKETKTDKVENQIESKEDKKEEKKEKQNTKNFEIKKPKVASGQRRFFRRKSV